MRILTFQIQTCPVDSEIYRESDVQDLMNSIEEVGLLQPLVLTPEKTIINGHRRFSSISNFGWTEVECEIKEIPEDQIDVHIVLYNQGRNKVATEILQEIKILYSNLWIGKGNNRGGCKKPKMRDVISEKIGISYA